ncbi:MAG: hypothetical protein U0Q16_15705 [Bryobacteraceae bacterium]
MLKILIFGSILSCALLAQVEPLSQLQDGIGGTANREVNLPPEEAVVTLDLVGGDSLSAQEAVRLLADFGVSLENLTKSSNAALYPAAVRPAGGLATFHTFAVVVPFAQFMTLQKRIAAFEKGLPEGMRFTAATALRPSRRAIDAELQRLWPELSAEARRKAETFANAAGVRIGRVITVREFGAVPVVLEFSQEQLRYTFTVLVRYAIAP